MDFNQILQFIIDNWQFFGSILLSLITFIVLVCKKKTKVVDAINIVIQKLVVDFVKLAEEKFGAGNGQTKHNFVFNGCVSYIREYFPEINPHDYYSLINETIEDILSTPQKKGE